jgi:hypothetical protein
MRAHRDQAVRKFNMKVFQSRMRPWSGTHQTSIPHELGGTATRSRTHSDLRLMMPQLNGRDELAEEVQTEQERLS